MCEKTNKVVGYLTVVAILLGLMLIYTAPVESKEIVKIKINLPDIAEELSVKMAMVKTKYNIELEILIKIQKAIDSYAPIYGLDENLIYAIIDRESDFDPYCTSHAGCYGLMQINYRVWRKELQIESKEYLYDIDNNIKCGCYVLKKYIGISNGDTEEALKRYFGLCAKATTYAESVLMLYSLYKET